MDDYPNKHENTNIIYTENRNNSIKQVSLHGENGFGSTIDASQQQPSEETANNADSTYLVEDKEETSSGEEESYSKLPPLDGKLLHSLKYKKKNTDINDEDEARRLFIQKMQQCTQIFDFAVDPLSDLKQKEVLVSLNTILSAYAGEGLMGPKPLEMALALPKPNFCVCSPDI